MEKKLLLACMLFGSSIFCSESDVQDQKIELSQEERERLECEQVKKFVEQQFFITKKCRKYENKKTILYKQALYENLLGNSNAIKSLFEKNEQEGSQKEKVKTKKQDNTNRGWGPTDPTIDSINGLLLAKIAEGAERKKEINIELQKSFINHKDKFIAVVQPILRQEIINREYDMRVHVLERGLNRCGLDEVCLLKQNVTLSTIMKNNFFDNFKHEAFESVIARVIQEDIPLTPDQIKEICNVLAFEFDGKEYTMAILDAAIKKTSDKLNDLLNEKKNNNTTLHDILNGNENKTKEIIFNKENDVDECNDADGFSKQN